ncbi:hypothetical protein [Roseisolibacter sp. H3M3-2]|uniref:hypothetical protein n=1 Tax=Roseisolibacter sp. H3M3-2 TaxID=3031323 RepID=UPI0023DBD7E4|nr:hypothetical protein [Roseisolibacter sp. H3M3-2]MDF1502981.1 hypothetical protein [Roseisolibacter sp. H3M3-2]
MPRALAIRYLDVPGGARDAYRARLAERTAGARACGYHLWAFEREGAADRVVEFVEAADDGALRTALLQDALLAESLDFRVDPGAPAPEWERYAGIPHAS